MTSAQDWSGRVGTVWAEEWQRADRTFAALAPHLDVEIDRAMPPHVRMAVDVGCGAGSTSISLTTRYRFLDVLGIDISPPSIAVAKSRSAAIPRLTFVVGDAAAISIPAPFDLLISRHGLMFFDDPVQAFSHLRAWANPGAAMIFSCVRGMKHNAWALDLIEAVTGHPPPPPSGYVPGPFAFADRDFTANIIASSGWKDGEAIIVDYGYVAGAGDNPVDDAVSTFRLIGPVASIIARAEPEQRQPLLDRLRAVLDGYRKGNEVVLPASAWIWTART